MPAFPFLNFPVLVSAVLLASLAACGGDDADQPAAVATAVDDTATVAWNQSTDISVLSNDTVANGTARLSVATAPAHGTATVDGATLRYTPAAGYVGSDSLTYTLGVGSVTSNATVHLAVAAQISLSGTIVDAPLPGATVVATIGGVPSTPVQADASGVYTLTLQSADPSAFVSLKATGAGTQAGVVLSSLVGNMAQVASAAASGAVAAAALPAANVTNISTAIAVLTTQALGKTPTSAADVAAAAGTFTSAQTIQMATAIKLIADAGVALPSGAADTLAMVSDPATYASFVTTQTTQNATVFAQTQAAVLSDPAVAVAPTTPASGGAARTLLMVLGEGAGGNQATRVVLNADQTATVEQDAVRSATWAVSGSDLTVTFDTPLVQTQYDSTDSSSGSQDELRVVTRGVVIRQIGGGANGGQATLKELTTTTDVTNPNNGVSYGAPDFQPQTLVSAPGSFVSTDFAPGSRWAGVLATHFSDVTDSVSDHDILRFVDAQNAVFESTNEQATYAISNGALVLTTASGVYTYQRLFNGPRGEERWLVEKSAAGATPWLLDVAAYKVQAALPPLTTDSLTHRWESYVNFGLVADKIYIDLLAGGIGTGVDLAVDGTISNFAANSTWSIDSAGRMALANGSQHRTWQLLGVAGSRLYVMEHLVFNSGYDQQRVNVYTSQ